MKTKKTFLEQLYYCDFLPCENIKPTDPDYWPTCRKIDQETTYLSNRLNSEDKERLDGLVSLLLNTSCMSDYDNFVYGLRAGVMLMHELMTL